MSSVKTPAKHAVSDQLAEILASALINDSPRVMRIDQLAPEVQAEILTARLKGPGSTKPHPEKILGAYYQCRNTAKVFPQGEQS